MGLLVKINNQQPRSLPAWRSVHIHILPAPLHQAAPPPAVPLAHPRPPIVRRHLLDPQQQRAQHEVRVRDLAPHRHQPVAEPVRAVLLQDPREEVERAPHRRPVLLELRARREVRGQARGRRAAEVLLAARGQPLEAERHEDRQERPREGLLDVVHEERLHGARALGEERARGVLRLEVLRDGGDVGEDDRPAGGLGVEDDGEGVDGSAVAADGAWRCAYFAQGVLYVWEFDPDRAVVQALII